MIEAVNIPEGERGPWAIKRFTVDPYDLRALRLARDGRDCAPGTYTKLVCKGRGVVMSDTPAERRDHSCFVYEARGHVLINGLGIGMCLAAVLRKLAVSRATVVEVDADVIALVAPHYADDPRVEIVHASAFDYQPPKGVRYGAVWHDIWDAISADNLPDMQKLHRKYARRADWQGSWARHQCERLRDEERRTSWRWR